MARDIDAITEAQPTRDKTTIGLTRKAREIAERIQEGEELGDLMEVALIGFSVAINLRIGIGNTKDAVTTWNVGTFDSTGQIRDLVSALYDGIGAPYRQVEYLVNAGLEKLADDYMGAESSMPLVTVLRRYV